MKRPRPFLVLVVCAALVLAYSFASRVLAQESDLRARSGASLDSSLDPLPRPTPTEVSIRPVLGRPAFSARTFYWGAGACGPEQVTISVNASDPRGIASVQMYVRLASQFGHGKTAFVPVEMDPSDTTWTQTINAWDIPGYDSSTLSWWLQFHFTAIDNNGAQTRSSTYGNNIELSNCVQLPG